MSFQLSQHQLQHTFRLDPTFQSSQSMLTQAMDVQQQIAQAHSQQPPTQQQIAGPSHSQSSPSKNGGASTSSTPQKLPYGAGDPEDGYDHTFDSMEEFNEWRLREEEDKCIEFIKGDTHTSKAIPPRFKEHTKLVCARHTRSGRKKYVKKHPERQRKVPSRKLEGEGCPASISYKTSFTDSKIKVKYNSEHSHEIGAANFPFTRRGRKAAAEKRSSHRASTVFSATGPQTPVLDRVQPQAGPSQPQPQPMQMLNGQMHDQNHPMLPLSPHSNPSLVNSPRVAPSSSSHTHSPHIPNGTHSTNVSPASHNPLPIPRQAIPPSVSMIPPPPAQPPIAMAPPPPPPDLTQQRWDRMEVLFQSIRANARNFEFPDASVATLESILIRLYLESPIGGPTLNIADGE